MFIHKTKYKMIQGGALVQNAMMIICSKDGNTQSVLAEKETGFATFLDENFSH